MTPMTKGPHGHGLIRWREKKITMKSLPMKGQQGTTLGPLYRSKITRQMYLLVIWQKQTVSWPSLMITLFVLVIKTIKDVKGTPDGLNRNWSLDSQQQMKFNLAKFEVMCVGRSLSRIQQWVQNLWDPLRSWHTSHHHGWLEALSTVPFTWSLSCSNSA